MLGWNVTSYIHICNLPITVCYILIIAILLLQVHTICTIQAVQRLACAGAAAHLCCRRQSCNGLRSKPWPGEHPDLGQLAHAGTGCAPSTCCGLVPDAQAGAWSSQIPLLWYTAVLRVMHARTHDAVDMQGASTVLYAASSPDLQGKNVLYLHNMQPAEPSRTAQDAGLAAQLWEASSAAVGWSKEDEECS